MAVDIDGVLADQITPLIPSVKELLGVDLLYSDVTAWDHPLADSHIGREILRAMEEPGYVVGIPVHVGARELLEELAVDYRVLILSARPQNALAETEQWLHEHGLVFDDLIVSDSTAKSVSGADVLVDDYVGNIEEFVRNSGGSAILVEQPWNIALSSGLSGPRVRVASRLEEVPSLVRALTGL